MCFDIYILLTVELYVVLVNILKDIQNSVCNLYYTYVEVHDT